jgi:hypothetical protein
VTHLEVVLLTISLVCLIASIITELRLSVLRIPGLVLLLLFAVALLIRILH